MRFFTIIMLFWGASQGFAQSRQNIGIGIILGSPTGLSAKYLLSEETALDGALAFGGGGNLYFHGAWLISKPNLFDLDRYPVNWYYGIGPRLINHDHPHDHGHKSGEHSDTHVAARAPIGLRMNFTDPKIELFGEISASLEIVPVTNVDIDAGLGARYYF